MPGRIKLFLVRKDFWVFQETPRLGITAVLAVEKKSGNCFFFFAKVFSLWEYLLLLHQYVRAKILSFVFFCLFHILFKHRFFTLACSEKRRYTLLHKFKIH